MLKCVHPVIHLPMSVEYIEYLSHTITRACTHTHAHTHTHTHTHTTQDPAPSHRRPSVRSSLLSLMVCLDQGPAERACRGPPSTAPPGGVTGGGSRQGEGGKGQEGLWLTNSVCNVWCCGTQSWTHFIKLLHWHPEIFGPPLCGYSGFTQYLSSQTVGRCYLRSMQPGIVCNYSKTHVHV